MPSPARTRADACPGVLATHDAADGALARVRLPGGMIGAAQLRALAGVAEEFGDGAVHLTSRANVQLRGLPAAEPALARRLTEAGLLPGTEHERVRNYLASPASGHFGGLLDVREQVRELDRAVLASPALAGLPGRFLFALDDGRGDVAAEGADLCWRALDAETGALLLAGIDHGLRVPATHAVPALVTAAETFLTARGEGEQAAWRLRELRDSAEIVSALAGFAARAEPVTLPVTPGLEPGRYAQHRGGYATCVAPVFGRLPASVLRLVAELVTEAVVTPWRTLLLPDCAETGVLARAGLVVTAAEPAAGISACIGHPGCAKSHADVRADARAVLPVLPPGTRAHFAGCERRCGRPRGEHADVLAEGNGYRVDGSWVPTAELADSLVEKGTV
ncbi:precorrin-3B synthase [Amycolatopsis aidingensis]|uniref:precorrin-3B synthase n=1 Tax=Amycolatopsis aidingensis TaxID=2842453 RepID=UPI001C0C68AE|nr:precorrin-3B synthase [Amycolatopsis aidingensis]